MSTSPAMEAICLKALAKDPARRFQSAREMRAALRALPEAVASHRATVTRVAAETVRPRRTAPGRLPAWTSSLRFRAAVVAFAAAGALAAALVEPWSSPPLRASPGSGSAAGNPPRGHDPLASAGEAAPGTPPAAAGAAPGDPGATVTGDGARTESPPAVDPAAHLARRQRRRVAPVVHAHP